MIPAIGCYHPLDPSMKKFLLNSIVVMTALAPLRAQQVDPTAFSGLRWRSIGPPRSGYVSAPAGIPGDPATYYVGLPEGGVWKTTNAGTTWKPIFDAVHVASIGAVAVAPSDPNVVYVGTGNQSGWSFTTGKGIYKSSDAGQTWTNVGLAKSQYIGGIVVDPRHANALLVAVLGPRAPGGRGAPEGPTPEGERGVYRSTDGGRNWTRVLPTEGTAGASDVYIDYRSPDKVFALLSAGAGGPAGAGAFRSADGGATWQPLGTRGLPDGARINAMTVASGTEGRRLYAVAGVGGGRGAGAGRALYRSEDGGDSWIAGATHLASAGGKMYADPQHPDVVYLMGTAIYRSTDGGRTIAAFWGAPSGADPRFLWIDPTNSRRMISGVDQGAAITMDGGATWTPYYGLVNGQFYRVSTDDDVPYHVCGPQQDSGTACVRSRSDYGEIRPNDWYSPAGFENGFLIADPLDKRYMYTQGWYHVLRRFDRTTNQVVVLYQPTNDDRFGGAPPLAFSADGKTLYMAAQHVMASVDRGRTWRIISPDLARLPGAPAPPPAPGGAGVSGAAPGGSIQSLAVSAVNPAVLWVGASSGLIQLTKDGGKTWSNVTPPTLPPGSANVIDASHADAGTAYVAFLSRDGHPHLYRTSNYGGAWQEISSGLTDGEVVRTIREDPKDPSILYAGTVTSVYVSFDRGDHWQSLQLNLPTTVVSDLTIKDNDIAISTYGRGFWILDDISPLRQARVALASTAAAFLYRPSPASRMRWDNTQDTPMPPEMVVGENPLEGAVIDYYLPSGASGVVTLTINDAAGAVVREYSSTAPPVDTTMANVPEYWLAPPAVLPTTAGMHRFAWDLRYPDPPTLNYGYSGTALDYREYTLSWHAIPGKTPRTTLLGPIALPGNYTVKLTVNGQTFTQPLTVVQDPRVTVTPAGLTAQFKLQQRMVAGLGATYQAMTYIQKVRAALVQAGSAGQSIDVALTPLASGPAGFGIAHRDLGRRLNDMLVADMEPTPSIVAGVDVPCANIDAANAELRKVQAQIAGLSMTGLPQWTPPPAPACGAK